MSAIQSRYGASSAILRSLGQMTPVGAWRRTRSRASAKSRVAGKTAATPSGTGASSSTRTKRSSMRRPALMSRINPLPEGIDADAGHRDWARVGQAAVVGAGAGDDVGDQLDVGRGAPDFLERPPQRRKITLGNMRQRQILLMADANLAETVALGEIGDGVHLLRGGIAGRPSLGLERERHDGIAGELVVGDGIVEPNAEAVVRARLCQFGGVVLEGLVAGIAKSRGDIGDHRRVERERAVLDRLPLLLDFARKFLRTELVDEDLDAGLVDIVAPAVLVVGAHDRLDVAEQITLGQEGFDGLAEEGGATEPPANHNLEAGLADAVAVHVQADVVNLHRGAIMRRRG